MVRRKGAGKGKGMGYKNIQPRDPRVHSDSSKGRKQPQNINLMRVPYGKPDTPPHLMEFQIGAGQPVGTIKEFEDFFKGKNIKLNVPMTLKEKMEVTRKSNLKDSDKDGVGDVIDCDASDPTKQDIVIKRDDVDYDVPFDWRGLTGTEKLKLVQEANLDDNVASKPLDQLSMFEIKELTESLVRRTYADEKELKKVRERNVKSRQERGSGFFESDQDKAKGIKRYTVVPPQDEVKRLVGNLVDVEDGKEILKMPSARMDFSLTYEFKGFTKSGNVILQESKGMGGNRKILKPYVFDGGLYVAIRDGTGTQILNLQTGR